jgi:hypothetical protein
MQKEKVNRLGGEDLEKRFAVAHRLYGNKPVAEMTAAEIAGFYDQYCHPHKSDHTVGETLSWFAEQGLDYWGSYPTLGFLDFVGMSQFRGEMLKRYPHFHTRATAMVVKLAMKLPRLGNDQPPFIRPALRHQIFWQAIYALQGARGRYSGGPALCGRKRPNP